MVFLFLFVWLFSGFMAVASYVIMFVWPVVVNG